MKESRITFSHFFLNKQESINVLIHHALAYFIIHTVGLYKEMTLKEPPELAEQALSDTFEGKTIWHIVTMKLDPEARPSLREPPKPVLINSDKIHSPPLCTTLASTAIRFHQLRPHLFNNFFTLISICHLTPP